MTVDNHKGFWLVRGPLGFRGYWVLVMMTGMARRQGYCVGQLIDGLPL
jgi:hypothetical protein